MCQGTLFQKCSKRYTVAKVLLHTFFWLASDTQMCNTPNPHTTTKVSRQSTKGVPVGATPWPSKMFPPATTATMGLWSQAGNDSPANTPARGR